VDAVLDSGGLTAFAARRPPAQLLATLEVAAATGGAVVLPTVVIAEATTGRPREDAAVNHRLARSLLDDCTVERARVAARLRFAVDVAASVVDAVVAATVTARTEAAVVTSDPDDLRSLLSAAASGRRVVEV